MFFFGFGYELFSAYRDYHILPKKGLHGSLWVRTTFWSTRALALVMGAHKPGLLTIPSSCCLAGA